MISYSINMVSYSINMEHLNNYFFSAIILPSSANLSAIKFPFHNQSIFCSVGFF